MDNNNKKPVTIKQILTAPFRLLKYLFWNGTTLFVVVVGLAIYIPCVLHTHPNQYAGTVIEVSSWDGHAKLKTKSKINGLDTILHVSNRKGERFVVGQLITVWTGGDLFDGIATTYPQK